ncbi:sulfurtransferase [Microbacterium paludicola]|uniref:Sulfurtransferase n=1 Tax=Microbacterium paludicola TaxID=300019 RepID=A0A4Y9FQQ1_9MICO|nr:sulfurtransferase [Microbacterium paludicola]MBF0817446.1 sulfurtransferase [Microbacterium paludicola]TFU31192.1 sulfurtransferase [Microbacterium paludicola]
MTDPLISADELAARLGEVTLLDVRWTLQDPDGGRPDYLAGHIPGAVFVDLHHELADPSRPATEGRHPLPSIEALQRSVRAWGVATGRPVVVYDATSGMAAARAWWLLRHAGVHDVRVLDGGLAAWSGPLETGEVEAEPGDIELRYGSLPVLTADDAAAFPRIGTLLDARAGERYRGEVEPIDPRAGHIPGAVSAPTTGNIDARGGFLEPGSIRARFQELGVDLSAPVAVYCGSGVTAAHTLLALAAAGVDGALYPGSWSQWSNLEDRPVATGPQP